MGANTSAALYTASTWIIPVLLAVTLHEAAHGYAARLFGDNTAWMMGRVTLNPFKHVDPFGTIILPGLLLLARSPFLFGYAKPVPVNFGALRNPRRDMVFVALAGPGTNIVLALISALLLYLARLAPDPASDWITQNLVNSIIINVVLAVFNMLPIPPLDGGRVAVGLLPAPLAKRYAGLEPYGFFIILLIIFVLPLAGQNLGVDLNFFSRFIAWVSGGVINMILSVTGLE
ncbi:MAG: site-2 protease family protein [Rhodomicrobium sp.]|jgi:Zn-dependent protease